MNKTLDIDFSDGHHYTKDMQYGRDFTVQQIRMWKGNKHKKGFKNK